MLILRAFKNIKRKGDLWRQIIGTKWTKIKLILSRDNINNELDDMVVDLLKSVFSFQPYS